ncbi:MAG: phosphoglycerate kinase [Bacillota bacterium]
MDKLNVKDVPVQGKKVLVRVDFNVPLDEGGRVIDDTKIRASLPTLDYLLAKGARVILVSHLGRPKGKVVDKLRMDPVARRLAQLLGRKVEKCDSITGPEVKDALHNLSPGAVLMLENVRFDPREEKNDPVLAAELAGLADLFVNDAFGTAHRAHASTSGITAYLPAVAGLLMEKEMRYLNKSRENPLFPLVVILGGKKVADKIGVIRHFLPCDCTILLGGAMANTFLKAAGFSMGNSLCEEDKLEVARRILDEASRGKAKVLLPVDVFIVEELRRDSPHQVKGVDEIPAGWSAVDIGPRTLQNFKKAIAAARMILWNGPLGAYEFPPFHWGTEMVARAVAAANAESIIGGGDIVAALEKLDLSGQVTHISTGGGAVLDFWEGKELPGLAVLQNRVKSQAPV